jgi:hypothetical protein
VLALAAIFATARRDLNEADFISRGVEESGESYKKSISYCHNGMETAAPKRYRRTDKPTGLLGNNTC